MWVGARVTDMASLLVIPSPARAPNSACSVNDNRADAFAGMHQVEALVDLVERQDVRDHRVDRDLSVHIHVDDLRDVGAALGTTERRAAPVAAGDELERARRDFLAGFGNADDDAGAPAAVAAFESRAHDVGIAGGVEAVVRAAVGDLDDLRDGILAAHARGVEEVGHPELAGPVLAVGIDVDADDLVRAGELRALDDVEADAAEAEHNDIVA